jgi:hypothetical protein
MRKLAKIKLNIPTPCPSRGADPVISPKTRVGVFRRHPSGRLSSGHRFRSMFTPGSRGCVYKTASGRGNWPNRDPIEEKGSVNLYSFVRNMPLTHIDIIGLSDLNTTKSPICCLAEVPKEVRKIKSLKI